jgi:hypothetical protein
MLRAVLAHCLFLWSWAEAACLAKPRTVAAAWLDATRAENHCSRACSPCTPSPVPLPPCDSQLLDSDGCWASNVSASELAMHVRHGAETALANWGRVWLPRTCSYHRFSALEASTSTCPRLAALTEARRKGPDEVVWCVSSCIGLRLSRGRVRRLMPARAHHPID